MIRGGLAVLWTLIGLFSALSGFAQAQTQVVNIGLYWQQLPQSILLTPSQETYQVHADGQKLRELDSDDFLNISAEGDEVVVSTLDREIGRFTRVQVTRHGWGASLKLKPTNPSLPERTYPDNLVITAFSSMLKMINSVFIEHYVSGVVEAEAGKEEPLEYYKVQSIICRTYALNNLRRHAEEGFYLCDKVHCQVFKGKSQSNPDIVKATQKTTGIVLVDSEINLITAAFHSNCGGHTVNSEDVWVSAVPYLRAREDTFCLNERHAVWHKTIPKADWLSYLDNRFQYPSSIKRFARSATEHCQNERKLILSPLKTNTYLKVIRSDWKLRSTFFCIDPEKDSITLHGKGYGHGVGLCQEGAMRQAKLGRDYQSILHYYYKDVHLVDLSVMEFFRAE